MRKKVKHRWHELPWQHPKPKSEDPKAEKLVKRLMESPSYRMAEEDTEFLQSHETRGIRLDLDYLKAELVMTELDVQHTIVVFGSARIKERKTALAKFKEVEKRLELDADNQKLLAELRDAERMVEMSTYYDDARKFGRLVGNSGTGPEDNRVILMTGGGPGIMEAANRGAYDVGAKSIGLNINLPHEQYPNPYISPELCFQFHYFAIRKLHFMLRAQALVAYPGGFGTLDELFEILTLIQTRKTPEMPVVLVGKRYWDRIINLDILAEEGMISADDLEIFTVVENAEEAWQHIIDWHTDRKTHLYRVYTEGEKPQHGKV
ncbi:TIGR00730 family Rossman fold protein [Hydrogenimonas sp.]|uniref:LOG family protein n=1 Tax=Hydrogenimonas sp. TaxID=2231112 RepID=UPI002638C3ED|nr:TIGR00730 family Rossman fold protein [Hydrogenimonas sp.]